MHHLRFRVKASRCLQLLLVEVFCTTKAAFAFTSVPVTPTRAKYPTALLVGSGSGWDNGSYLDALSKGSPEREQADEAYYRTAAFGKPAQQDEAAKDHANSKEEIGQLEELKQQQQPQPPPFYPPNAYPQQPFYQHSNPNPYPQQLYPPNPYAHHPPPFPPANPYARQQQPHSPYQNPYPPIPMYPPPLYPPSPYDQPTFLPPNYQQQLLQLQQQLPNHYAQYPSTPPPPPQQEQQQLLLQHDNDGLLNDRHRDQSEDELLLNGATELPDHDIQGAVLTDEMKAKAKASHTPQEEASGGGEKFRALMARAQQKPTVGIPHNVMELSMEEQARLFREITLRQQLQYQQYIQQLPITAISTNVYAQHQLPQYPYQQTAPPQYLPPGIGYDGKKIGCNRDAHVIQSTADVYFARLKRDSTTRNIARINGDTSKANAVFHDPAIAEIKQPQQNPHLEEQRKRERELLETVPEEMLILQEFDPRHEKPRSYRGISYKEQIVAANKRRLQRQSQQLQQTNSNDG